MQRQSKGRNKLCTNFKKKPKLQVKSNTTYPVGSESRGQRSFFIVWVNAYCMEDLAAARLLLIKALLPCCSPPESWAHRCLWAGNWPGQSELPPLAAVDLRLHPENLCHV